MVIDTPTRSRHRIWAYELRAKKLAMLRERMAVSRAWVSCLDLAKWVGRDNEIEPDPGRMLAVYRILREGLMDGEFEVDGKSHMMCLHPTADGPWRRLRQQDENWLPAGATLLDFLPHCWIPTELAMRWLRKRKIALPEHLFPTRPNPSTGTDLAPVPGQQTRKVPLPVSKQALRSWYADRVGGWPAEERGPSQDRDLMDAREAFPGRNVTRSALRAVRVELAPEAWTAGGRPIKPRAKK